ncbi:MAG: hypothetical protein AAF215_22625 [Cyanobacteria bacterium P01_A01_bin.123]
MDSKILASGSIGFVIGIITTLLVSALFMGGMMWRGGMMRGWGCNRSTLQMPTSLSSIHGFKG